MRILIIIAAIVAGPAAGFLADCGAAPAKDVIIRYYDLSTLPFEGDDDIWETNRSLIPFHPQRQFLEEGMIDDEVGFCDVEQELIMEVIYTAIGEEHFEHNGALIELTDQGLRVKGSEEIHATVSRIIDFMAALMNRRVSLDVEVYSLEHGTPVGVVEADSGLVPLLKTTLQGEIGDLMEISDGISRPIVWDYDPEIAQAAVVSEGNVDSLFVGLDLALRPLIAADGKRVLVALYGRSSRLTQPIMPRDIRNMGRLSNEQGIVELPAAQSLDDPRIEFAGVAGTLITEPGKPALVQACFPHLDGVGSLLVSVTSRLHPAPDVIEMPGGLVMSAFDLSHLQAAYHMPFKPLLKGLYRHMGFHHFSEYNEHEDSTVTDVGPPFRTSFRQTGDIVESLIYGDFFPELEEYEDEIGLEVFYFGDTVFVISPPELRSTLRERLAGMFPSPVTTIDVDLRFVEVDGPAVSRSAKDVLEGGTLHGMTAVPMMRGGRATSIAGFEGLAVDTYSVEVANNAAIADPVMVRYMDGAHVQVRHEPGLDPGQSGTIRTAILVNRLTGPVKSRNLGDRGGLLGVVDQPSFNQGFIDTRFDADGDPHILGSISIERDGVLKTLYVIGKARSR
jgi:hypothetical protein